MTRDQYQHEVTQNAISAYSHAVNDEERNNAFSLISECFSNFWTLEREKDFLNYESLPAGTICPLFKD